MIHAFDAADVAFEGFLSGFLHDAACAWDEGAFDRQRSTVSIKVERMFYEKPQYQRALGFLPVTKLRIVPSLLTVRNVTTASIEPTQVPFRRWLNTTFAYCELRGLELLLAFEGGDIKLNLSRWEPITLLDTGPPSTSYRHTYGGWPTERFQEMARELQTRRSDA